MSTLGDALDVLYAELERQGVEVSRAPGMAPDAVVTALEARDLPAHQSIVDFFTWSADAWVDVFLCPMNFDRAVETQDMMLDVVPLIEGPLADLFPLLSGNGDVHISVHVQTGELYYVDIEGDRCEQFAPGAVAAVQAVHAGLLSGTLVYDADDERDVIETHPDWSSIREDHRIRAIAWH